MAQRTAKVVGAAAVALGLAGALTAWAASGDEPLHPAAEAVAGLPTVTDFRVEGGDDTCAFDPDRGGLVHRGLTVTSGSSGVLELTFHVQRDSLDDVLPGYVSAVLVFDEDTRTHTLDVVVPVTQEDHDAGYDECQWGVAGR